jgi:hypothetical protein
MSSAPALSDGFLAAYRGRLDALGRWEVTTQPDGESRSAQLWVHWPEPPPLAGTGVRFDLWFNTSAGPATPDGGFDPDERMFRLLDEFLARRDELVGRLRQLAADFAAEHDLAGLDRWELFVIRSAGPRVEYELAVNFYAGDQKDWFCWTTYDPAAGTFGEVED